jgi:hypothetical protein
VAITDVSERRAEEAGRTASPTPRGASGDDDVPDRPSRFDRGASRGVVAALVAGVDAWRTSHLVAAVATGVTTYGLRWTI